PGGVYGTRDPVHAAGHRARRAGEGHDVDPPIRQQQRRGPGEIVDQPRKVRHHHRILERHTADDHRHRMVPEHLGERRLAHLVGCEHDQADARYLRHRRLRDRYVPDDHRDLLYTTVRPPSTGSATPVMKPASSDARKSIARATSSGVPGRASGQTWFQAVIVASMSYPPRVMGVSMKPGQTQFTRIPWRAPSTAAICVS